MDYQKTEPGIDGSETSHRLAANEAASPKGTGIGSGVRRPSQSSNKNQLYGSHTSISIYL